MTKTLRKSEPEYVKLKQAHFKPLVRALDTNGHEDRDGGYRYKAGWSDEKVAEVLARIHEVPVHLVTQFRRENYGLLPDERPRMPMADLLFPTAEDRLATVEAQVNALTHVIRAMRNQSSRPQS